MLSASASVSPEEARPWTYGAEAVTADVPKLSDIATLVYEHGLLRTLCERLAEKLDASEREKRGFYSQLQIFRVLTQQLKNDRYWLTRQLAMVQREIHYLKRGREVSLTAIVNGFRSLPRKRHMSPTRNTKAGFSDDSKQASKDDDDSDDIDAVKVNTDLLLKNECRQEIEAVVRRRDSERKENGERKRKLAYTTSLLKSIEFSRSMLDVNREEQSERQEEVEQNETSKEPATRINDDNEIEVEEPMELQATRSSDHSKIVIEDAIEAQSPDPTVIATLGPECNANKCDSVLMNYYIRQIMLDNSSRAFCGLIFDAALSSGVIIKKVLADSAAATAGLQPGDQVLEIAGINMRSANYQQANKIMADCELTELPIKVMNISLSNGSGGDDDDHQTSCCSEQMKESDLKRQCTLTRRDAFKMRNRRKTHVIDRQQLMLYQTQYLTVKLPRRIHVHQSLCEAIRLTGGNAVGIFVHSILDQVIGQYLQRGDRILEYNRINLRNATAEEAAIQLARPAKNAELLALFDLDTYQEIEQNALGDSFYIRAQFSANSLPVQLVADCRALEFQRGDILYVDSTMFEGRPGYWRAWKVNEFGLRTTTWGVIPSLYEAQCELVRQRLCDDSNRARRRSSTNTSHKSIRRFFAAFALFSIFRRRRRGGYEKLGGAKGGVANYDDSKTSSIAQAGQRLASSSVASVHSDRDNTGNRILASFTYQPLSEMQNSEDAASATSQAASLLSVPSSVSAETSNYAQPQPYQMITLVESKKPRPVILFGPFSDIIALHMEQQYPSLFRASRTTTGLAIEMPGVEVQYRSIAGSVSCSPPCSDYYLQCTRSEGMLECISLNQLVGTIENGFHPIVVAVANTLEQFRRHQLHPLVGCVQFRSPRHLKLTANQSWKAGSRTISHVSNKVAKTMFTHSRLLEAEFGDDIDFVVPGNNLSFMATVIKKRVEEMQRRITWNRVDQSRQTSYA